MKLFIKIVCTLIIINSANLYAQEHYFTQFNSLPLSINPAFTGLADEDWRFSSIIKSQWIGNSEPIHTQNISIDGRFQNPRQRNYFGVGGLVIAENIMGGFYKTNYLNLTTSYHQPLDDDGNGLILGIGFINGSTRINPSQLYFDEQISNAGFNRYLSSGETLLGNKSNYNSASLGLVYNYDSEKSYFDIGISCYQFIHSKRSLLNADNQRINSRYTLHADFGGVVSEIINANLSLVGSRYANTNYISASANIGILMSGYTSTDDNFKIFNIGMIYKMNSAVAPLLGYTFNNLQFGISYDVNISTKSGAVNNYKNVELSIKYRKYLPSYVRKSGRYHSPS